LQGPEIVGLEPQRAPFSRYWPASAISEWALRPCPRSMMQAQRYQVDAMSEPGGDHREAGMAAFGDLCLPHQGKMTKTR